MKVIRSYASLEDAVNVKRILFQLIELEIEKILRLPQLKQWDS